MTVNQPHQAWKIVGFFVILLLLLLFAVYHETLEYLLAHWNQLEAGDYGHGYLVLAISVYLIQRNLRTTWEIAPCPQAWGLIGIGAAMLLWLVSALAYVEMMKVVALWLLLLATVWTVLGTRVTVQLMFPLLYLGFALPIWFPLSPILQEITADVVFWVVRLFHIPAFREENLIILPAGMLSIEEACSGLRYLLAALTLGTLYGYINYTTLKQRIYVVLISALLAVVSNSIRVFVVVYLGYITEMQHPFINDHLMFGWYLFAGMMFLLLLVGSRISPPMPDESIKTRITSESLVKACRSTTPAVSLIAVLAGLLLISGPAGLHAVSSTVISPTSIHLAMPAGRDGWTGPMAIDDDWHPKYKGAITLKKQYQRGTEKIIVFLGYYPQQKQGEELISDLNRITHGEVWHTQYTRGRQVELEGLPMLEQLLNKRSNQKRLVLYWYHVAGLQTTNKYLAKLLQILGSLSGSPEASIMAVATDIEHDTEAAQDRLKDFMRDMGASLAKVATTPSA